MKQLRLTEEQLLAIQKRAKERGAVIKVNRIATPAEAKPNSLKYGNRKTVVDGFKFDSKREAERCQQLKLMQQAGEIHGLERQVPFDLKVNGVKVCRYVADFVYVGKNGKVCEDVKGYATSLYKLKRKLMKACLNIDVLET